MKATALLLREKSGPTEGPKIWRGTKIEGLLKENILLPILQK
jgi:hypothetical protein